MKVANGLEKRKQENREAIVKWFEENPNTTKADCHRGTGISRPTIDKHIREIEKKARG